MFPSLRKENLMADGQRRHSKAATDALNSRPGGEVVLHRPNGEIRDSNTINQPDPFPPRG
jgi:hypothetical protein